MPSERFIPGTANLSELFGPTAAALRVPMYQRRYAWNHKQEVAQLWQDVTDAFNGSADEYFLGTIVLLTGQGGRLEIIDGQQRLATLTMILAAIRNKLTALATTFNGASHASSKLHDLIMRTDLMGHPLEAVLTLGAYDQESFRKFVQLRPGDAGHLGVDAVLPQVKPGRPPTNRVREAFKQLGESAAAFVQDLAPEQQMDKFAKLAAFIYTSITHITIKVSEDTDAFTLFETVNYRGLDLSTADLLKNHLCGLAKNDQEIEELTASWTTLVDALEDQQITRFLRYFWLSKHGYVSEKDLYRRIKEYIKSSASDPRSFLAELTVHASTFAALVSPKDNAPCALELRDLLAMRMIQGIPFLMAAREKLEDDAEFVHAVRIVETLSTRNTLVGKRNPNELERRLGEWARQLRSGTLISDVAKEARDICLSDSEFEQGFKELSELSSPQARYLLRKIEWLGNKETQIASAGVDIEHILPQSPNPRWTKYMDGSEEEVLSASQRLGNLTLLNERLNKQAAAKPFTEKRDNCYAKSNIKMTSSLTAYDNWSFERIAARQSAFAKEATQIWSL